jgi:hypothetical protein
LDDFAGDGAGEGRAALMDVADGVEELAFGLRFEEIAAGPGLERAKDDFAILMLGEHDDLEIGQRFLQFTHAIDAGHFRQLDVHEDDVRWILRNGFQGFFRGGMRGATLDIRGAAEDLHERFGQGAVVFDDHDGFRHGLKSGLRKGRKEQKRARLPEATALDFVGCLVRR